MEVIIVVWLLLSVGVGYLASERGRSGVAWALISILTSPLLGLIIVLLLSDLIVDASNREQNQMRHREQLAALGGNTSRKNALNFDSIAQTPQGGGAPPVPAILIADEIEKLVSLRDRGHLSEEEFLQQKARLLGKEADAAKRPSQSGVLNDAQRLKAKLASPEQCKAYLIANGCRVAQPTENVWEVLQPSGLTAYAQSPEALQDLALRLAVETPMRGAA